MFFRKYLFAFSILLTIFFVIAVRWEFLFQYFTSPYIQGWDSATHFGFFKYYSTHIFPGMFDWIPTWYSGMAFPVFYPPLFFFIYSIIDNFLFIIDETTFKIFQILTYFVTPLGIGFLYYFGHKKNKNEAALVTIFSFLISILPVIMTERGFGFAASLKTGLITQAFSFPFLLAWIFFTYRIREKAIYQIFSVFLLILLLLTNIHAAFTCLFLYFFFYIRDVIANIKAKKTKFGILAFYYPLKIYLINGGIALLAVAFWYLPMISLLDFSTARPLDYPFGNKYWFLFRQSYQLLIPLFLLFRKIKKKQYDLIYVISLFSITTFLFNLINVQNLIDIPFHPERMFGSAFLLFPLLLIELFNFIWNKNKKAAQITIGGLIAILVFFNFYIGEKMQSYGLFRENKSVKNLLNESYKYKNGLFIVEPSSSTEPIDALINTYLGLNGIRTTYSILRESSLSSIFFVGIRNSFSEMPEYWSIRSRLATSPDYLARNIDLKIRDAIKYGVTHVVVKSNSMKTLLSNASERISRIGEFDDWDMYQINYSGDKENQDIEILDHKPVLLISDFDAKNYTVRSLDYISVAEEMLRMSSFDVRFVYGSKKDLDTLNFNDFSLVLLEDKYLVEHPEILTRLLDKKLDIKVFVPIQAVNIEKYRGHPGIIPYQSPRDVNDREGYMNFFVGFLRENVIPTAPNTVSEIEFSDLGKNYKVVNNSDTEVSLIIKRSYFPSWKSETGLIYMVNPSYIYLNIKPNEVKNLYFSIPPIVGISRIISIIGILIFLIYSYFIYKKYKKCVKI
jgi:hypothetical protein